MKCLKCQIRFYNAFNTTFYAHRLPKDIFVMQEPILNFFLLL